MREIKVRLSTIIYLLIITILVAALGTVCYISFEKNANGKQEENSNIVGNAKENTNVNENSDFETIEKAIQNVEYNDIEYAYKNGKIKKITVNSISIWKNNEYAETLNINILDEYENENIIIGECEYTVEFENIEDVEFAGSGGGISNIVGNSYVDDKCFIYNREENKLELCTSLGISMPQKYDTENSSEVPITDLVAVSSMQREEDKLFFAYIEDGKLYYFYESNVWLLGQYEYDEKMKLYDGIDNAKRIKMYNLGTGILPTVYVITEDGKVYRGRLIYDNFVLELDNRLAEYEIDDILSENGEMYEVFELLLKDGTTKIVTFPDESIVNE